MGGIGEAGAKLGQILPTQGGGGEHLDLVGDEHQLPGVPVLADAPGGVGDHQGVAAQQAQHPHGVGHLLIGIALVVVHPALHHGHGLAVQHAAPQAALVAGGGGCL